MESCGKWMSHGSRTALIVLVAVGMFLAVPTLSVLAAMPPEGIGGTVRLAGSGAPLSGITVTGGGETATTNSNGNYWLPIYRYGSYTVKAESLNFGPQTVTASITMKTGYGTANFNLNPKFGMHGYVTDETGAGIQAWVFMGVQWGYTQLVTAPNGYYYYQPLVSSDYPRAYTYATYAGYWKSTLGTGLTLSQSTLIRQDFMCPKDSLKQITQAAIFSSVDTSHTWIKMGVNVGWSSKTEVTCSIGGTGGTKTTTYSVSFLNSVVNQKSLIVTLDAWMTGEVNMYTKKVVGMWVREVSNQFGQILTIPDYKKASDVPDSGLPLTKMWKQWVTPYSQTSQDYIPSVDATGSVAYQYGLSISVPLPVWGLSIGMNSQGTITDTQQKSLYVEIINNGATQHNYKFYMEGTSATGGMILHVWEVG